MLKSSIDSMAMALLLLLFLVPISAHADVYSWVDANGVRHFSNTGADGAGDRAKSSPEITSSGEEAQQIQREGAEKTAWEKDQTANENRLRKTEEESPSSKENGDVKARQEKERAELQAKCKKAKERLSTLRFTSLDKYENAEVEKYAMEWPRRHQSDQQSDEKRNWRKTRDEDVQKYKKFKYDQELKQAEKEVDAYCTN